jgi:hypothetical protein
MAGGVAWVVDYASRTPLSGRWIDENVATDLFLRLSHPLYDLD